MTVRPVFAIALVLVASSSGRAQQPLPARQGHVTDLVGVLDAASKEQLVTLTRNLQARTTAQLDVVVIPTTGDEAIQPYSVRLFHEWGIGSKDKDNGVLFLVAINDRKLWMTTGYGLEGILPDGNLGRIRDTYIRPKFRANDYAGGIVDGTRALVSEIAKEYRLTLADLDGAPAARHAASAATPANPPPTPGSSVSSVAPFILGGTFGTFFAVILALAIRNRSRSGRATAGSDADSSTFVSSGFDSGSSADSSCSSSDSSGGGDTGGGGAGGDW